MYGHTVGHTYNKIIEVIQDGLSMPQRLSKLIYSVPAGMLDNWVIAWKSLQQIIENGSSSCFLPCSNHLHGGFLFFVFTIRPNGGSISEHSREGILAKAVCTFCFVGTQWEK